MGLHVTFFSFRFVLRSGYPPESSKYTVLVSRRLNLWKSKVPDQGGTHSAGSRWDDQG